MSQNNFRTAWRIGAILLVQAAASAVLFIAVGLADGRVAASVAFAALGFFVLGFTGVYYSCMATWSRPRRWAAPPPGDNSRCSPARSSHRRLRLPRRTADYAALWFMLGALVLAATVFVARIIVTDPPAEVNTAAEVTDP